MNSFPHYFIGIPVSQPLQNALSSWQDDLKNRLPYKQWPNKHDLHITLKFLGPVDERNIQSIKEIVKKLEDFEEILLEVGGIGTFGNPKRPRVLWAGVKKNSELASLQAKTETYMAACGFQKEQRDYHPHITLAKKWDGSADKGIIANVKEQYQAKKYQLIAGEVVLYQIFPKQTPKYKVISSYGLRGGADGAAD
ncbi:RNA 2',3'-cyclic phosphodiesterase [Virgibacillus dakarensis]|nr:RNA 2',3'-cyclic phosphodiesterase [Virgibacillus dakarensis]